MSFIEHEETIECKEAAWPSATVVIGNPPFLGNKRMRKELGETYTAALRNAYRGRVPGGADLVCYWFAKAKDQIETSGLGAAGLVATNSIRSGANREVLDTIVQTTRIFEAWSDEPWVNEGAAVRVSLVAFGGAHTTTKLNGIAVDGISSDLLVMQTSEHIDGSERPVKLDANVGVSFQGAVLVGDFEITQQTAVEWLRLPNSHGQPNSEVLKPLCNGRDINSRGRDMWVVDFNRRTKEQAMMFEKPFEYVEKTVKPQRADNTRRVRREQWWIHGEHGGGFRAAIAGHARYIATSQVSKHRIFVWLPVAVCPHQTVIVFARSDDTTLGVLQSRIHELWSLHMGSWMGKGNDPRYTPTTCFSTFPFPDGLAPNNGVAGIEATDDGVAIPRDLTKPGTRAHAIAIGQAAKTLVDRRDQYLNPPEWTERVPGAVPVGRTVSPYPDRIIPKTGHDSDLQERALTKLYNNKPAWLRGLHEALDGAVASAYEWADYTPAMPDEEITERLLALNLGVQ
ncbi:hypothetical protein RCH10_004717 [Variovorax sp. GrIS 2.14]